MGTDSHFLTINSHDTHDRLSFVRSVKQFTFKTEKAVHTGGTQEIGIKTKGYNKMKYCTIYARRMALCLATVFAACVMAAQAGAVSLSPWTISGPGTTSVSGSDISPVFTYDYARPNFNAVTWTAEAMVLESGTYSFDWNYTGFHAFFAVTASLGTTNPTSTLVSAGPNDCCTTPSAGFNYSGRTSFDVTAGETIGFVFGGDNNDRNNVLRGTLTITSVPTPAAGFMLLSVIGAAGFVAKRKRRAAA